MPQSKQIFFDPDRKRWRRLRLIIDSSVIVVTLLVVLFVVSVLRGSSVPGVALPDLKRPYHALKDNQKRKPPRRQNTHRKTKRPASQVVSELRRRHSRRLLCAVGRGQLRLAEGVLPADRLAVSRVDARAHGRWPAAGGNRVQHASTTSSTRKASRAASTTK